MVVGVGFRNKTPAVLWATQTQTHPETTSVNVWITVGNRQQGWLKRSVASGFQLCIPLVPTKDAYPTEPRRRGGWMKAVWQGSPNVSLVACLETQQSVRDSWGHLSAWAYASCSDQRGHHSSLGCGHPWEGVGHTGPWPTPFSVPDGPLGCQPGMVVPAHDTHRGQTVNVGSVWLYIRQYHWN